MKKNMKKKISMLFAVVAIAIVSGIIAFLTDTGVKFNDFSVGSVEIDLVEEKWDEYEDTNNNGVPDVAERLVARETVEKDPKIVNEGNNSAYVYMVVQIPKAKITKDAENSSRLFTYTVNEGWTELESAREETEQYAILVYYYSKDRRNTRAKSRNTNTI